VLDDLQEAAAEEPSKAETSRCDQQIGSSSTKCADLRVAASIFQASPFLARIAPLGEERERHGDPQEPKAQSFIALG